MKLPAVRLPTLADRLGIAAVVVVADLFLAALLAGWVQSQTARQSEPNDDILPARVVQAKPLPLPRSPLLHVESEGTLRFNGAAVSLASGELEHLLSRYRATAQAARVPATLVVRPAPETPFHLLAPVLRACTTAGIGSVRLMY